MSSHGRSGGGLIRPQHRNLMSNKNHNCNARTTLKWVTNKFDQLCALITAELEEKDIGELLKMPTPNYKFEGPNQSGTNRT
jgi:hypothetical protein